ncbi:MAG: hypothetical protein HOH58_00165 [Opitutaceae bacterium]|jgi:hypothetical protein|nr:hypothetical protein [Opitutaceae bacterium]
MRLLPLLALTLAFAGTLSAHSFEPATAVTIAGDKFLINGKPTYEGLTWRDQSIEGRLFNARLVQATFDDENPATRDRWAYPDTGVWDAERNVREFLAAMPTYRRHGLLGLAVNLQGGSPEGYSKNQPWENNAFNPDGTMRPAYQDRMGRVIEFADQLGMVVILGYFYFGQDERLTDEAAVINAVDSATQWILQHGWTNVIIEVNNECDVRAYQHDILMPDRVPELIARVRSHERDGRRLLVTTSFKGNTVPSDEVVAASDYVLVHGNGVHDHKRIVEIVEETRELPSYEPKPIVFNEDDHYGFDVPHNNFTAAISAGASWGYFDYRMDGEGYDEGHQSVPVNWGLSSERKRGFFRLLAEITQSNP